MLKSHRTSSPTHVRVAESACAAISHLASSSVYYDDYNSDNNSAATAAAAAVVAIASKSIITILLNLMREHATSNQAVAANGCTALHLLAINDTNRATIAAKGGLFILLDSLRYHGASSAEVAENGCATLWSMADNDDYATNIINGGGGSLMKEMKTAWLHIEGVQDAADGVLTLLGIKRRMMELLSVSTSAAPVIVKDVDTGRRYSYNSTTKESKWLDDED